MFADAQCGGGEHSLNGGEDGGDDGSHQARTALVVVLLLVVAASLVYLGQAMFLKWRATKRAVLQGHGLLEGDDSTVLPQTAAT